MKAIFSKLLGGVILTLAMGLAGVATPVLAQNKAGGQDPKMPKTTAQTMTINGKVTTVTDSSLTVVDGQKNEQIITLSPNTKVTKGGKDATLADLKADDSVVVVATKDESNALTAVSITAV
jgi:hypothetical protein